MSDNKSKLSDFFAKNTAGGAKKFRPVKINIAASTVKLEEEIELDAAAQASMEQNIRSTELISSAGWVNDPDAHSGPVVHASSKSVVGMSTLDDDDDSDDAAEPAVVDDAPVHPMDAPKESQVDSDVDSDEEGDALSSIIRKKGGWAVPTAPAASSGTELSSAHFPTLAAAKEVGDQAAIDDDGFRVVGGSRGRNRSNRGPASMGSSRDSGVNRGGWVDSRPKHLRLRTSNKFGSLS